MEGESSCKRILGSATASASTRSLNSPKLAGERVTERGGFAAILSTIRGSSVRCVTSLAGADSAKTDVTLERTRDQPKPPGRGSTGPARGGDDIGIVSQGTMLAERARRS